MRPADLTAPPDPYKLGNSLDLGASSECASPRLSDCFVVIKS